jgi:hypothetical protein
MRSHDRGDFSKYGIVIEFLLCALLYVTYLKAAATKVEPFEGKY